MSNLQTTYTAAKNTKRGTRIWIEGQKLSLAGLGQSVDYLQPLKLALNLFQTMNRNALLQEVA